jgi:predicted RNase H-like HicB family nuclease
MSPKTYTVTDGELVLILEVLPKKDGGGYGVTSPLEPQLVTEAKTFEEAFEMARDAFEHCANRANDMRAELPN